MKNLISIELIESKLNFDYQGKVEKKLQILTQCQGLLEGEVSE